VVVRSCAVRRSSAALSSGAYRRVGPQGCIETKNLHWLAAKSGFDTAFSLSFDKLRTSLNRRFGSQPRNYW
jgi:hypothetical protein